MTDSVPGARAAATAAGPQLPASAKTLNALLHLPAQMELSQIELIYRAEGNANLVLALPQFKKVLRLPKMISSRQTQRQTEAQAQHSCHSAALPRPEGQPSVSDPTKAVSAKAGDLTMPDFMAYIEIMRRLLGNEFVCKADIVAIPKEGDRFWINEHIRSHRPVARLDKEFVGPFGLLLPDVTQLPATFDVLLANLQAKDMNMDMNVDICIDAATDSTSSSSQRLVNSGVSRLGTAYAIEIKPKQGWLQLASDVSNLFDLMPAGAQTMDSTYDPDKCRCRYCSMQLLKLHTGKIQHLGDYCPLDLFSGSPRRMLDALNALFACPQNNLRVFQSGNLIYGDHANSISCEELQTRVFPGEIMALIKHLLVACLLREYNNNELLLLLVAEHGRGKSPNPNLTQSRSHVANVTIGESALKCCCGMKTKATETTEIGGANVDVAACPAKGQPMKVEQATKEDDSMEAVGGAAATTAAATAAAATAAATAATAAGRVEFVKAVAGQPQRRSTTGAAVEKATQRYTKRSRITTTATDTAATTTTITDTATTTACSKNTTIASNWLSANVPTTTATARTTSTVTATATTTTTATATGMPTETETKTLTTVNSTLAPHSHSLSQPNSNPKESQALINEAEIFHLPKNCVLQKILHLQLLVKRHFQYMWQAGYAEQATPSYSALQALLNSAAWTTVDKLPPEQAYLLGATALDCSIMLTFQEINCQCKHNSSLEPWLVTVQGRQFLTKLSILDLDPKPDSHFHKFIKQTRQIEKSFAEH